MIKRLLIATVFMGCAGCSSLVGSVTNRFADNLTTAILEQDDPALVREGVPAYLLLLDSLALSDDAGEGMLGAAAQLYAAYAVTFVDEAIRSKRLSNRGFSYGKRAVCTAYRESCAWPEMDFDEFVTELESFPPRKVDALYAYTVSWLAWLRAHSDDWSALTDLPRVEAALVRLEKINVPEYRANVNLYLGVLNSLRPPALGGDPEKGRQYFEQALVLSEGKDLSIKVEFARGYARLVYDRELHDLLLHEVLAADPHAPGLTLSNTLAQQQAKGLLETADEYF